MAGGGHRSRPPILSRVAGLGAVTRRPTALVQFPMQGLLQGT